MVYGTRPLHIKAMATIMLEGVRTGGRPNFVIEFFLNFGPQRIQILWFTGKSWMNPVGKLQETNNILNFVEVREIGHGVRYTVSRLMYFASILEEAQGSTPRVPIFQFD
jgi:hypothetical protein